MLFLPTDSVDVIEFDMVSISFKYIYTNNVLFLECKTLK